MNKLVFVGAGWFAQNMHGPALAYYNHEHPDEIELAAVCVKSNITRAREFSQQFGFKRVYTNLDEMLDIERPDICWVVSPITETRKLVGHLLERGVPVFFEKPPGVNSTEAAELAEISKRTGTPNMVAFNRRWAPCTRTALRWTAEQGPVEYIYARMLRTDRMDEDFAFGTGIHLLDCILHLAKNTVGELVAAKVTRERSSLDIFNFHVDFEFALGAKGRCDILPACGMLDETYTLFGPGRAIVFTLPWTGGPASQDGRAERWSRGRLRESVHWPLEPQFLSNGIYGEAEEFINALREGRRPYPAVEDCITSVVLAEAVQAGRNIALD